MDLDIPVLLWHRPPAHSVFDAAFSVDARTLVTASDDCRLALWTCGRARGPTAKHAVADPAKIVPFALLVRGHAAAITAVAVGLDEEGQDVVLSLAADGSACLWDARDGRCLRSRRGLLPCARPDAAVFVTLLSQRRYAAVVGHCAGHSRGLSALFVIHLPTLTAVPAINGEGELGGHGAARPSLHPVSGSLAGNALGTVVGISSLVAPDDAEADSAVVVVAWTSGTLQFWAWSPGPRLCAYSHELFVDPEAEAEGDEEKGAEDGCDTGVGAVTALASDQHGAELVVVAERGWTVLRVSRFAPGWRNTPGSGREIAIGWHTISEATVLAAPLAGAAFVPGGVVLWDSWARIAVCKSGRAQSDAAVLVAKLIDSESPRIAYGTGAVLAQRAGRRYTVLRCVDDRVVSWSFTAAEVSLTADTGTDEPLTLQPELHGCFSDQRWERRADAQESTLGVCLASLVVGPPRVMTTEDSRETRLVWMQAEDDDDPPTFGCVADEAPDTSDTGAAGILDREIRRTTSIPGATAKLEAKQVHVGHGSGVGLVPGDDSIPAVLVRGHTSGAISVSVLAHDPQPLELWPRSRKPGRLAAVTCIAGVARKASLSRKGMWEHLLLSGDSDGMIRVWLVQVRSTRIVLQRPPFASGNLQDSDRGHRASVTMLSVPTAASGTSMAIAMSDGIVFCSASDDRTICVYRLRPANTSRAAESPAHKHGTSATGVPEDTGRVTDPGTPVLERSRSVSTSDTRSLDGLSTPRDTVGDSSPRATPSRSTRSLSGTILEASSDHPIASIEEEQAEPPHSGPDRTSSSAPHGVRLERLAVLVGHPAPITGIRWRTDAGTLLALCANGMCYVWQLASGHLERCIPTTPELTTMRVSTPSSTFSGFSGRGDSRSTAPAAPAGASSASTRGKPGGAAVGAQTVAGGSTPADPTSPGIDVSAHVHGSSAAGGDSEGSSAIRVHPLRLRSRAPPSVMREVEARTPPVRGETPSGYDSIFRPFVRRRVHMHLHGRTGEQQEEARQAPHITATGDLPLDVLMIKAHVLADRLERLFHKLGGPLARPSDLKADRVAAEAATQALASVTGAARAPVGERQRSRSLLEHVPPGLMRRGPGSVVTADPATALRREAVNILGRAAESSCFTRSYYTALSFLFSWGVDPEVDDACRETLGLNEPSVVSSFGIVGDGGAMSLLLPHAVAGYARWRMSPYVTAQHRLSLSALLHPLALVEGRWQQTFRSLYDVHAGVAPAPAGEPTDIEHASLGLLADWGAGVERGHQNEMRFAAARRELVRHIRSMPVAERLSVAARWTAKLMAAPHPGEEVASPGRSAGDLGEGEAATTLVVSTMGVLYPAEVEPKAAKLLAPGLLNMLTSQGPHKALAAELVGRGFRLWQPYWSTAQQQHLARELLLMASVDVASLVGPPKWAAVMAAQAVEQVASASVRLMVNVCLQQLASQDSGVPLRAISLKTLAYAVQADPRALQLNAREIVEPVLVELNPTSNRRVAQLARLAAAVLKQLIVCMSVVAVHQHTNRLCVGLPTGKIAVYNLANSTRVDTLEGFRQPVSCVAYSPEGSMLAAYCVMERSVRVWRLSSGSLLGNLFNKSKTSVATPLPPIRGATDGESPGAAASSDADATGVWDGHLASLAKSEGLPAPPSPRDRWDGLPEVSEASTAAVAAGGAGSDTQHGAAAAASSAPRAPPALRTSCSIRWVGPNEISLVREDGLEYKVALRG